MRTLLKARQLLFIALLIALPAVSFAQVNVSIKDRTTGKYWGGTAFDQSAQTFNAASLAGNNWHYALAEGDRVVVARAAHPGHQHPQAPARARPRTSAAQS